MNIACSRRSNHRVIPEGRPEWQIGRRTGIAFIHDTHVHDHGDTLTIANRILYLSVFVAQNAQQTHEITFYI